MGWNFLFVTKPSKLEYKVIEFILFEIIYSDIKFYSFSISQILLSFSNLVVVNQTNYMQIEYYNRKQI